ncbi:MAG: dTMP kinase [bacterium]|nr:dTMP kinase [bacterium]
MSTAVSDPARRGLLITFEGPEGSGKSTLIRGLAARLAALGRPVVTTREPGGTPVGERIRDVLLDPELTELRPETELLLMVASRAQLVREIVRPALAAGRIVLCDRYADASVAYQGAGRELGRRRVDALNDFAVEGTTPDLTLLCLLPPAAGRERCGDRDPDRLERETAAFHERVYGAYLAMAASGDPRFRTLDATAPPAGQVEQALAHLRGLEHDLLTGL